jgi:DNA transformation protein
MPYWSIPDEAIDDPDLLTKWVRLAGQAGRRGAKTRKGSG